MFYLLSKILDLAVAPLTWALALLLAALVVRSARRRTALLLGALAVLAIFASPPVANRITRATELPAEQSFRPDVTYDVVILLGGFVEGAPSGRAADGPARPDYGHPLYNEDVERLLAVFDLLRRGQAKSAILSGGVIEGGGVEAQVMADQLVDWGIDRSRLILEGQSKNTRENAVDCAALLRARAASAPAGDGSRGPDLTVLVVTSAFHAPRAHGCFRAVGLAVDMLPVDFRSYDPALASRPILPRAVALEESTAMIRERVGRLVYRLQGYSAS